MQPLPVQPAPCSGIRLTCLPAELLGHILFSLSSLSDVLSLAATCQRARVICDDNATSICRNIVIYYRQARQLLADQGGPKLEDRLLTHHVAMMLRNWRVIERSITQFEWQVVRHITCTAHVLKRLYGLDRHPLSLTPSERRRFVRSYYTVWSLMIISPNLWPSRLAPVSSIREFYYLTELCLLPQSIGRDESLPLVNYSGTDSDTHNDSVLHFVPSEQRQKLREEVLKRIEPLREYVPDWIREWEPVDLSEYGPTDGYGPFVLLCDHFQSYLKQLYGYWPAIPPVNEDNIWSDSEDEDDTGSDSNDQDYICSDSGDEVYFWSDREDEIIVLP
ncbi:hypothetical protein NA57DRAFT_60433 [Rhizodiscina lignyota]|uniref:F-box domain-containing protein n=1 Tax=Rhizodiscina lignyota TaxID=1504668 RepID=A0A9P4I752_9PEZI|nr:hypothetical protein NA57DRAFT_60433 [Rhizodiscina lignyota]